MSKLVAPSQAANPGGTRRINRRVVVSAIQQGAPISRADIAKSVGLTPASVSTVVRELIDDELVEELAPMPIRGVGKPATPLGVRADGRHIAVLDLSRRDSFVAALVDLAGRVIVRLDDAREGRSGDVAIDAIHELLVRVTDASDRPLLGIGVASPGLVVDSRFVVESAHLAWHGIDLAARLSDITPAPVIVANDANAGALGEVTFGSQQVADMLYVRIDDGVGAGIVLDGRLHVGSKGGGGEIGHTVVESDGPLCVCGNRGCLETLVSEPLSNDEPHPSDIEAAGRSLGAGLASVVSILDVDHVAIGGVGHALDQLFIDSVAEEIRARTLGAFAERLVVRPTSLRSDDVLLGAAAMVREAELGTR